MAKVFIYSTLTSDQLYTNYGRSVNGVPQPLSQILIKGGANLMTKSLVTPMGVVTEVTDADLVELKKNEVFKLHMQNGFITVQDMKKDIEVVVSEMDGKDQSAPITPDDDDTPLPASKEELVEVVQTRRTRGKRS